MYFCVFIFSRVLAPPGGKDSISFSAPAPAASHGTPSKPNTYQAARNSSNVFESNDIGVQSKGGVKSCQEARQKSSVFTAPLEPIPVPKKSNGSKSHGNILAADSKPSQEQLHTSVHVRAPPGGVSHISFG